MNRRQIFLVLQREYLTRVRSKVFIVSTLLIPFGFIGYFLLVIALQFFQSEPEHTIGIVDQTGILSQRFVELDVERYKDLGMITVEEARNRVMSGEVDGFIALDEEHVTGIKSPEYIYKGSGNLALLNSVRNDLREVIREERLSRAEVTDQVRSIFETRILLESRKLTDAGVTEIDQTVFYSGLGFVLGLIIFLSLFMYGTVIMRGVIEEKSSRIVEVLSSSVRPIGLLTGKILGITCVAITQFTMWFVLTALIVTGTGPVALMVMENVVPESMMAEENSEVIDSINSAMFEVPSIDFTLIFFFFIFFVLGYFIYSALFAVVGSAVDSESDTQQLMIPIFSLIFIAYSLNIEVMQNPDSTLSVLCSLFPFFSPINMITRLAISQVPAWQIILSLLLMIGTLASTMWLSARIYRIGILQYGGKAGFRDLFNWVRQK